MKTTFDYDGLNRVKNVTFSDDTPDVIYTYDQARAGFFNNGALTRVETTNPRPNTPLTATEFDYDLMGRVTRHNQMIGTDVYNLEYGYNLAGQLKTEKYPSGKVVTNSYDIAGRLTKVNDQSRTYLTSVGYEGRGGAVNSMVLGNGTAEGFAYNERLQLSIQNLTKPGQTLQQYNYGYGQIDAATGALDPAKNNGQLAQVESTIGTQKQWTQKFNYDAVGRLSESKEYRGDNADVLTYRQKFDFDSFGNLYKKQASNPIAGQANPLPFIPIEDADISKQTNRFTTNTVYDEAGNVKQDTKFRQLNYSYDANGRMFNASDAENAQSNSVYDASGNRVATQLNNVWTYFIYDAFGKLIAEYNASASINPEKTVKYIQKDWQGSTRTITDGQNGQVKARMDYTAFGEEINSGVGLRSTSQGFNASNNLSQKYALTERDKATGLDHTWFRKNENKAGRWTSPDPYLGSMDISNPQSFNRYAYVGNDPLNFVDPSGLNAEKPGDACNPTGKNDADGNPIYLGTVGSDGKCQSNTGTPAQVYWIWGAIGGGSGISTILFPQEYLRGGNGIGGSAGSGVNNDRLPFDSCAEFVNYLVKLAVNMGNQKYGGGLTKAKVLGEKMMITAYFEYDRHSKSNGYRGFKSGLVRSGEGTIHGAQGANVYGHVMAFGGATLSGGIINAIGAALANEYDHGQIIAGNNPQAPSEAAGNRAGYAVGNHMWNYMTGVAPREQNRLKNSLSSELCD